MSISDSARLKERKHVCIVCDQVSPSELTTYRQLPRVTSDCKPWCAGGRLFVCDGCGAIQKIADANWFAEIERIYKDYEIYKLSGGAEQVIFSAGGTPTARSPTLVDFVISHIPQRETGHLLDIGCGNGSALINFSRALPNWRLDGSELSDAALTNLQKIPGFDTLHTGPISRNYHLISLIHSLEHMSDPRKSLLDAREMLHPDGHIFVEVPDAETSPFDILIADHLSHFTRPTLAQLCVRAGINLEFIDNTVIPKEISMIATPSAHRPPPIPRPINGRLLAEHSILWLEEIMGTVSDISRQEPIAIFGTSIAAMWLFGFIGDRVNFFVDEDTTRIGGDIDGRPIISPQQVPDSQFVYVPLPPAAAKRVVERRRDGPGRYILPPAKPDIRPMP